MNENITSPILDKIQASEKPVVVLGIGIPASGKSTLLEHIAWKSGPNTRPINLDAIRNRLIRLNARASLSSFLERELYQQVDDDLVLRGIALVDSTNLRAEQRVLDIGRYRDLGALTVGAVFMDVSVEEAHQRNAVRSTPVTRLCIDQMSSELQNNYPTLDEGFTWIATVHGDSVEITDHLTA